MCSVLESLLTRALNRQQSRQQRELAEQVTMIKETSEATQSLTRAVVLSNESIAARVKGLQERVEDEVGRVQKKVGEDIQEVQDQLSVIEKARERRDSYSD